MERIIEFIYQDELPIEPNLQPLLMTVPVLNPVKDRDRMYEILFEKFEVRAAKCEPQPLLSMYASGRNTGMVLEIGT
jgi:actin-related protein